MSDSLVDIQIDEAAIQPDVAAPDPRTIENGQRIDAVSAPVKPEGLPDNLWDTATNDVKKDALLEAYKSEAKQKADLRAILSKGIGKPAESVNDYTPDLGEDLKQYVPDDDKGMVAAKQAALDAGMPKEMFDKFLKGYLGGLKGEGLLNDPTPRLTPEEQAIIDKAEDDKFREEQMEILGDEGKRQLGMLTNEIQGMYKKGSLSLDDIEAFKNAAFDAKGVQFMAKLLNIKRGQQVIPTQTAIESGRLTREELDAMGLDPRMKTDPSFRAKRSNGYKALETSGLL